MRFYNKKRVLIVGSFIFLPLALFLLIKIPQLVPHKIVPHKRIKADALSAYLKDGDIICRLGDRLWSRYFKDISVTDKRFSHLGIIRISDDKITVINAEGRAIEGKDFVNEVTLEEFLEIAKTIGIYRLSGYDGGIISSAATHYIGYPFDWSFDTEDENKLYCTELLYVVLKKIAPEITLQKIVQKGLNKEIIPLEACSDSEYFTEVIYVTPES
jgi:hypothetical protein